MWSCLVQGCCFQIEVWQQAGDLRDRVLGQMFHVAQDAAGVFGLARVA